MSHPLRFLRSKFLRDTATLQVAGVLNQGSQVVSTVLIAFLLGASGQGLYAIAVSLQALVFFLLNVGVVPATVSQIAAASARGMEHKTAAWVAFIAKAVFVVTAVTILAGAFVLPWLGRVWYPDEPLVGTWAFWLCFQSLLELPKVVATCAFQGTRRMLLLGQLENGHELARFFLVATGALVTGSAAGAVAGQIAAGVVGSVIAAGLWRRARTDGGPALPGVREILRWIPEVPLRKGVRLGFRVGLVKNAHMMVMTIAPRLIIGGVVSFEYAAYFHIAQRILQVPLMLTTGVSRTMLPAMGELKGLRDMARFRRLFLRASITTGGAISAGILLVLPLVPVIVRFAFPHDYVAPVTTYTRILAIGAAIFSFAVANEAFFIAANQVRLWMWLSLAGSIVTVPANVWLILNVDVWGTAWGVTVYQSWVLVHFACIGWVLWQGRHQTGFDEPAPRPPAEATGAVADRTAGPALAAEDPAAERAADGLPADGSGRATAEPR